MSGGGRLSLPSAWSWPIKPKTMLCRKALASAAKGSVPGLAVLPSWFQWGKRCKRSAVARPGSRNCFKGAGVEKSCT